MPVPRLVRVMGIAVAIGVLPLAGCAEHSRVDPNADVTLTGSVLGPDGQPVANRPVRLGAGVSPGDATFAVLTAGLACTTGVCQGKVHDTSTTSSGDYTIHLKGRDTQSTFGEAESELLSVTAAPVGEQVSGAAASARFRVQAAQVTLPTLRLVDPRLALGAGAGQVDVSWSTDRPGPFTLSFETRSPVPVWQVVATGSRLAIDARLLEDTVGRAELSGTSTDRVVGSTVALAWRSPGVGYAAAAGAPPSRGRPCRFVTDAGTTAPARRGCGLTDGDLSTPVTPAFACPSPTAASSSGAPCAQATQAVITLPRGLRATLVVVRGCEGGCTVETSGDGRTFVPRGSVGNGYGVVALGGEPVSAVRVSLGTHGLREVSVWGPASKSAALRPLSPGAADDLRGRYQGDAGGGHGLPLGVTALAGALVAVTAVGLAYVLGRRRRT